MGVLDRAWWMRRVGWIRRQDLGLLIAGAIVLLLAFFFVKLGSEVREQETAGFDRAILVALRTGEGGAIGPRWLARAMRDFSALGSGAVATLVVVVATASLVLARRRVSAAMVALSGIGAAGLVAVLTAISARERPTVVQALDEVGGLSFPSGHTVTATAVYLTLAVIVAQVLPRRRMKAGLIALGAALALLVGFTRIFIGVHYPTDVAGGWLVGCAWAIFCWSVARLLEGRARQISPPPG
jgi:undecaprenyl-diphosphatase